MQRVKSWLSASKKECKEEDTFPKSFSEGAFKPKLHHISHPIRKKCLDDTLSIDPSSGDTSSRDPRWIARIDVSEKGIMTEINPEGKFTWIEENEHCPTSLYLQGRVLLPDGNFSYRLLGLHGHYEILSNRSILFFLPKDVPPKRYEI